jgi:hypothetical protein
MAQTVFTLTKSIFYSVMGRGEQVEETSEEDLSSQTQQTQSHESGLSSKSNFSPNASHTENEGVLNPVTQTKRRLEHLREKLIVLPKGNEEKAESLREDILMAEIQLKRAQHQETKRVTQEKLEREMESQRQLELQKRSEQPQSSSETRFISREEHQRQMLDLIRRHREVNLRKQGPPRLGGRLDPDGIKDLPIHR